MAGAHGAFAVGLAVALEAGAARASDPGLPRGEIVERVVCRTDPARTYALYLPSRYDASRPWPVVFALDPVLTATMNVS